MISLSKHIEILLLDHDCVIVPGLGGFIANQAPARIDDNDSHNMLPPYRTIGFNRELSVNDGLLVQSYMQAYDAAYPEALLQMEKDINKMLVQLDTIGNYTLDGIGTLSKNIDGSLAFTAFEAGILTPSLYGLYSIVVKTLEEAKKEKEIRESLNKISLLPIQTENDLSGSTETRQDNTTTEQPATAEVKQDKEEKKHDKYIKRIVSFRPNWKEFSVASAVAVVMFFLFQFPSLKSGDELNDTVVASTIYLGNPSEMGAAPTKSEKSVVTKPASYKSIADKIVENNKTTIKNKVVETQPTIEKINENPKFVIVLASCVSKKNATLYIESFEKEGFKEARFVEGKINRVHYSGYSTYTEATNALNKLQSESELFKDAWILSMN
ncbi:MAG: hypothetical protein J6Y15_00535 [Bacteroidaceae bacterium]|nr:hypothetical protein [Bacteroidaceae bacterium]